MFPITSRRSAPLVWVDLCNPDHEMLCELADELDFDHHAVEDTVAHAERTKATRYATHTFLTVYATRLGAAGANDLKSRLLTAACRSSCYTPASSRFGTKSIR